MKAGKVHAELARHYPKRVVKWVRSATWTRQHVPLSRIQMDHRPGHPHDPVKVAAIRRSIRAGRPLKPVVLVNTGKGQLKIADGYHRTRALELEGHSHVPAVVARVGKRTGPWSRQMHDAKLNA